MSKSFTPSSSKFAQYFVGDLLGCLCSSKGGLLTWFYSVQYLIGPAGASTSIISIAVAHSVHFQVKRDRVSRY